MAKNILILGGSYFAGRSLVEHLVKKEDMNPFVFNRGNIPLNISGVTQLHGDRTSSVSIKENIPAKHWDVLIDFCGYTSEDIETVLQNVPGRIDQYIYLSSTSVYDSSSVLPYNESSKTVDRLLPELGEYAEYALDKVNAETRLKELCYQQSIQYTILRPSIIYGKFNYAPRETYFFDLIENNDPVIIPRNDLALFNFIFVADLAKIIICCMQNKTAQNQVFNTVSPEYFSYDKYVNVLQNITQKKITLIRMSTKDIVQKRIALPFPIEQHQIYSGDGLSRALGFDFTPLEQGLKQTYEFYQFLLEKKKER